MNIILYPWFLLVTSTVSVCYIRVLMSFTNVGMTHGHDHDQQQQQQQQQRQQQQPPPPPPPYLPPHLPHPDSHPPRPPIFRDRTSITIIWDNTNHSPFTIASHVSIFLSVFFQCVFDICPNLCPWFDMFVMFQVSPAHVWLTFADFGTLWFHFGWNLLSICCSSLQPQAEQAELRPPRPAASSGQLGSSRFSLGAEKWYRNNGIGHLF